MLHQAKLRGAPQDLYALIDECAKEPERMTPFHLERTRIAGWHWPVWYFESACGRGYGYCQDAPREIAEDYVRRWHGWPVAFN